MHVPVSVHKKGGKIKKCEYGGFASEEEENAWYESLNQEIEDENQSNYMSGNLYGGEDDGIPSTSYSDNKTYSFGPKTG